MTEKRILLFGGSGQIGTSLRNRKLPSDWVLNAPGRAECDFSKPGDIGRAIRAFAPDLVINAAAMTDIDACERDPESALLINFDSVAQIMGHCVEHDAPVIHLSTDYVFDGADGGKAYEPGDAMNPLNAYGQSKMMGEEALRHGSYGHVIVRTSLVFSAYGRNVLTKTLRQIDENGEITAMIDQTANPTAAAYVAQGLIRIADTILSGKSNCFGTFHLCQQPETSRYIFAQAIADIYGMLTGRQARLNAATTANMPGRVPRPAYSALNCEKTFAPYGIAPGQWRADLVEAITLYATHPQTAGT